MLLRIYTNRFLRNGGSACISFMLKTYRFRPNMLVI